MWSGRVNPPPTPTVTARDVQRWIATEASPLELAAVLAAASCRLQALAAEVPRLGEPALFVETRPMTPEEFYARRRAAGLTMEKAASLLGVSVKSVWRYESGAITIPALRCAAIRSALPRLEPEPTA